MIPGFLRLEVVAYRAEARDVVSMELRDPLGRALPAFTPGAHLEIWLPPPAEQERAQLDTDGFDHPQKVFDLTEALIRRGYSDDNITAILGATPDACWARPGCEPGV